MIQQGIVGVQLSSGLAPPLSGGSVVIGTIDLGVTAGCRGMLMVGMFWMARSASANLVDNLLGGAAQFSDMVSSVYPW